MYLSSLEVYLSGSPIVLTALLTGLRKNDILNLKWQDVDLEKGILYFFEHKQGQRKIKILCEDMVSLLKELPRGECEYIFHDRKGNRLT